MFCPCAFWASVVLLTKGLLIITSSLPLLIVLFFRKKSKHYQQVKASQKLQDGRTSVAFFHPYCNAGGGGERVLWCGVQTLQQKYPQFRYLVYTGDTDTTADQILANVKSRFNITIEQGSVEFLFLNKRSWVEAHQYPRLTLIGQSLGSMVLGLEALDQFVPDIFIDTMGYAFTLPLFKRLGQCRVAAYVHYPTISTDMLARVSMGTSAHNNDQAVAGSRILTTLKLFYYRIFASLYAFVGRFSDIVMVNSSWTQGHINSLWKIPSKTFKVFPPCDVEPLLQLQLEPRDSCIKIVSVAQFRPEKDHLLQLQSLTALRGRMDPEAFTTVKLLMIGSCRNSEDESRVEDLKQHVSTMELQNNVDFFLNIPYDELKQHMVSGILGIHTMWNEHFGIGIVECLAAGLITVAHKSGGPMMDIIEDSVTGYLATTAEEYAAKILNVIQMNEEERREIQCKARASLQRFSATAFSNNFVSCLESILE